MPSKFTSTAARSTMSAAIGWVDGSWSWTYAQDFSTFANVVQDDVYSVADTWATTDAQVANDSLSQRSSHQRMVTRSPNHMCAISCRIVSQRRSYWYRVTLDRKTYSSRKVTAPAFSMAPALNSGTNSWSYLPNGYRTPKALWKKSNPCLVWVKSRSASRCSASVERQKMPRSMPS